MDLLGMHHQFLQGVLAMNHQGLTIHLYLYQHNLFYPIQIHHILLDSYRFHHQFHHYNPGKSKFGEERYFKISKRIYKELDERLSKSKYLSGKNYTIADIGTFPWIARHEWHDIGLKNYKNLTRWYDEISKRDGVKKGFAFMDENEVPPKPY